MHLAKTSPLAAKAAPTLANEEKGIQLAAQAAAAVRTFGKHSPLTAAAAAPPPMNSERPSLPVAHSAAQAMHLKTVSPLMAAREEAPEVPHSWKGSSLVALAATPVLDLAVERALVTAAAAGHAMYH